MATSNALESITAPEQAELDRMENVINKSYHAFFKCRDQLHKALCVIRDKRLYRKQYTNFEEYCLRRWGKTARWGRELVELTKYGDAVKKLNEETGSQLKVPKNVHEFRKMKKQGLVDSNLQPKAEQCSALLDAPISQAKGEQRDYSNAYTDGSTGSAKSDSEVIKDKLGYVVPDHILPLWKRGTEIAELMTSIRSLKLKITNYENLLDPLFRGFHFSTVQTELGTAWDHLNYYLPEVVCYLCEEKVSVKCTLCGGRGFITKHRWEKSTTKHDRETRPQLSV